MDKKISETTRRLLIGYQRTEITDHHIYTRLAGRGKNPADRDILARIASDEKKHAEVWKKYTHAETKPNMLKVLWYSLLGIIMGYTFVLKLTEKSEYTASEAYAALCSEIPEALSIIEEEQRHEEELSHMLDEERLRYVGAMVLGLNDALVELTGAMAGFSFALSDTRLVAMSGIITGVSATLSMAASNYLAERAEGNPMALKASLYTGLAYLFTVVFLVLPYLLFPPHMYLPAMLTMLAMAVLIILFFNYYISVAKSLPFARRFGEMAAISLGVACISFAIGLLVKHLLGIEI